MIREQIEELFSRNEKVYIYGASKIGEDVYRWLRLWNLEPDAFVVSDGMQHDEELSGLPIIVYEDINKTVLAGIIVAVSDKYISEITNVIKENDTHQYLVLDKESRLSLYRETHPISSERFIRETEPVSRLFGFDRGTPVDRYYMEDFIAGIDTGVSANGTILEVGEDTYSKRFFINAKWYEVLDYSRGVDLTKKETLKESGYDVFLCMQTYNFIYDFKTAIENSHYLLKNNGLLIATVAGNISQVSHADSVAWGDYWRFTEMSIGRVMREVFGDENVQTVPFGNVLSATAFIQGMSVEDLDDRTLLDVKDPEYAIMIGVIAKCVK